MATRSVALPDPRARSEGEGDAGASASLRDAVPRVGQRNPSGSRNKGSGRRRPPLMMPPASHRDALLAQALVAAAEHVAITQIGSFAGRSSAPGRSAGGGYSGDGGAR